MAHSHNQAKLSLPALTAMVVGSMIGAGIFTLPQRFGAQVGVGGAFIAWGVAGMGTLMLALVFQRLAIRKRELDSGMYAYAGNASYWILVTASLGPLIRALGAGNTGGPRDGRHLGLLSVDSAGRQGGRGSQRGRHGGQDSAVARVHRRHCDGV